MALGVASTAGSGSSARKGVRAAVVFTDIGGGRGDLESAGGGFRDFAGGEKGRCAEELEVFAWGRGGQSQMESERGGLPRVRVDDAVLDVCGNQVENFGEMDQACGLCERGRARGVSVCVRVDACLSE